MDLASWNSVHEKCDQTVCHTAATADDKCGDIQSQNIQLHRNSTPQCNSPRTHGHCPDSVIQGRGTQLCSELCVQATFSGKLQISFAPVNYILSFKRRKLQNEKFYRGHTTDVSENVRYGVSLSKQNECTSRPDPGIAHLATVFEHLRWPQPPTGLPNTTTQ